MFFEISVQEESKSISVIKKINPHQGWLDLDLTVVPRIYQIFLKHFDLLDVDFSILGFLFTLRGN